MKETIRTKEELYTAWVNAVNICHKKGWHHVRDWVFMSPGGHEHDLSATNLDLLDEIEKKEKIKMCPKCNGFNTITFIKGGVEGQCVRCGYRNMDLKVFYRIK